MQLRLGARVLEVDRDAREVVLVDGERVAWDRLVLACGSIPTLPPIRGLVRRDGTLPYLRPDGKTQVTIAYDDDRPVGVETVVLSTQHAADIDLDNMLAPDIRAKVIEPVLAGIDLDSSNTRVLVNPTGRFVTGGPMGDAGLTGRKIIVDTYGGMARHGGGAFSGKDPSKVDRSGAYAARWVAKNLVAAGAASRCASASTVGAS